MTTLTPGDGQDVLAAYKRAWERRDPDAALELYAQNAEHRSDPFEPARPGLNEIRAMWNNIAATQANVEFDAERVWVSGLTVLSSYHAAWTDRSSGTRYRQRGFLTLELNDQKRITRARDWPVRLAVGTDSTHKPEALLETANGR
jgi:ketosteroid isomerase-like protein